MNNMPVSKPLQMQNRDKLSLSLFKRRFRRSIPYYILMLLPMLYLIIFKYLPMYGIQIAFRDYKASLGILKSPWVGLKYLKMFLEAPSCWQIIWNTFIIALYSLLAGFPMPIILAIALNECRQKFFRKTVQMVTYMPYFISTVVLVAMITQFSDQKTGIINVLIARMGGAPKNFMGDVSIFRHIYVWTGVWQSAGYSAVVYLAALSGVNTELYDAVLVDGASKWQRIIHIDIPSIMPTVIVLFILNTGSILSVGFEKIYLMQSGINLSVSEVISTYVYKLGLMNMNFSMSTAVGLFNSLINFAMLVICNSISRRVSEVGLW